MAHDQTTYQWLGLAAGLLPLSFYHYTLSKSNILSPAEVDSVYYFGFLVTVITLVSTAISIGLASKLPAIQWILLQFGLGLVATGYALFARLQLMAKSSAQVEMDVVESTRRLVESVTQVSGEFDRAGYQATAFVEKLHERLEVLIKDGEVRFEESLKKSLITYTETIEETAQRALGSCEESIDRATNKFSDAISKVIEEIKRVQSEAETISFAVAAERMAHFTNELEASLQNITAKTLEASTASAEGISELATTTRKVQKLAIDIAAKLEKLENTQQLVETILNTAESLSLFNDAASTATNSMNKLGSMSNEASKQIDNKVIEPLSESSVVSGLNNLTKDLPEKTSVLASTLGELSVQAAELTNSILSQRKALEQTVNSISKTSFLDSNMSNLDGSVRSVTTELNDLLKTIEGLKRNLNTVSDSAARINSSSIQSNPNIAS